MIDLMKHVRRGIPMVVVTMVMVLLAVPGWAADGDELKSLGYAAQGKTVQCSVLNGDMQLKILYPLAYQWDDERYCVLYVMDSRSDEQVAAAVAAFDNQRDAARLLGSASQGSMQPVTSEYEPGRPHPTVGLFEENRNSH